VTTAVGGRRRNEGRRIAAGGAALVAAALWAGLAQGQPPAAAPAGPKLPAVTAFPAPGLYANTTGVALLDDDPDAEIHYTWDGSRPTSASPRLERGQLLFIAGVYDGDKGLTTGYTLRAVATKPGHADSDPATLAYTVERRDRTAYVSELVAPGVRMIRDSDNDKMFLVSGERAFALRGNNPLHIARMGRDQLGEACLRDRGGGA